MAVLRKGGLFFLNAALLLLFFLSTIESIQGKPWHKTSRKKFPNRHPYPDLKEASTFSAPAGGFDYIVIGGGTAGCPLAATLSKKYKVLLLERGGSPYGNINVTRMENFHVSLADLSPKSASQVFISTDGVINARARVLGGGTAINAGFYTRASPSYVESVGWDAALVNESYPWIERQIVHWPKVAPWQAALRDGLLEAGVAPFNGYTFDHIYGTKVGGSIFDSRGLRSTAADVLHSAYRKNLVVLLHATVQKIVFDESSAKKPVRAVGVLFKDENGRMHRAELSTDPASEVMLSAGAMATSQLLMLSGVGPRPHLEEMGIPVVHHSQYVGKGMSDNPMNAVFIPSKEPVVVSLIQTVGITKFGSFIEASSGFSESNDSIKCHHGIMSAEIGQLSTIPPKQRSLEAMKAYATNKHAVPHEAFQGGFILEKIDGPYSRGHLALADTDPDSNPKVTFNYFSDPRDLKKCVLGIRTIERVIRSGKMAEITGVHATVEQLLRASVAANVNLIPKQMNDTASLEQFCKDTVITIWHYHGGCNVGKVVDEEYKVLGLDRVRVVDGSVFDMSPGTNPAATVLMLGRYVGVKILRQRLGKAAGV